MAKNKQTKLERYGNENYNNMDKQKQTCLEKYGCEWHNQNEEIAKKISDKKKTDETQRKYEQTMLTKYGNKNPNLVKEIRDKYIETLLKNYGVTNPLKNKDIYNKHIQTMKENHNFNTSKPEEELYRELCDKYGVDNVERQYDKDERYPFSCDFYVKSEDLFIELNIHPSHYTHRFNPNDEEDKVLLEKLKKTIQNGQK